MVFACFAPSSDTFATLPRGVVIAQEEPSLARHPSRRRAQPDPRAVSSDALYEDHASRRPADGARFKRVSKAMVGAPTGFQHKAHLGSDEIQRAAFDRGSLADLTSALARLAAPLPDPPYPSSLPLPGTGSPDTSAPPSRPLSPTFSDADGGEEGNAFGGRPRSPPPDIIRRPLSPIMDETASADAQVHQQRKVKRKAAPVFVPSKIISAPTAAGPAVVDAAAITKSDLPVPLDHKGRPMHRVAGQYMTDTTKGRWDGAMDAITKALKDGAEAPAHVPFR